MVWLVAQRRALRTSTTSTACSKWLCASLDKHPAWHGILLKLSTIYRWHEVGLLSTLEWLLLQADSLWTASRLGHCHHDIWWLCSLLQRASWIHFADFIWSLLNYCRSIEITEQSVPRSHLLWNAWHLVIFLIFILVPFFAAFVALLGVDSLVASTKRVISWAWACARNECVRGILASMLSLLASCHSCWLTIIIIASHQSLICKRLLTTLLVRTYPQILTSSSSIFCLSSSSGCRWQTLQSWPCCSTWHHA